MTVQTKATLASNITSILADNTVGAIDEADIRGLLTDTLDTVNSFTGWAQYGDTVYTSGSPLAVNNARVQLTNNAGSTVNSELPSGVTAFWASDKITPENAFDFYNVRVDFTAVMNTANGFATFELDIGGGIGVIVSRNLSFPKGTGVATKFSIGFPVYTGSTFLANGGQIYLTTADGADNMNVYAISVFVGRVYKGE